jgi:hypothetical protein
MQQPVVAASPEAPVASRSAETIVVKRIRFAANVSVDGRLRRQFTQPDRGVAIEESLAVADLPSARSWPEPTDQLIVVCGPRSAAGDWESLGQRWLAPPDHPDAPPAVAVEYAGSTIEWRPGRAVVHGRADRLDETLTALADFAFYEGKLRELEQAVEDCEAGAPLDAARAHNIAQTSRDDRTRFAETMGRLAHLRLAYARLEPRLAKGSRSLPVVARRLMTRLIARADVEDRLVALNDRLEACEDLYEGANDRVADHRGWSRGHLLELAIVALLLVELLLTTADLWLRWAGLLE